MSPTTWAPFSKSPRTVHVPTSPVHPVTSTRRSCQNGSAIFIGTPSSSDHPQPGHIPGIPRGPVHGPEVVEVLEIAAVIHGLPETVVEIRHEFAIAGQAHQRRLFKYQAGIIVEPMEQAALKDEIAAVNPAAGKERFFV